MTIPIGKIQRLDTRIIIDMEYGSGSNHQVELSKRLSLEIINELRVKVNKIKVDEISKLTMREPLLRLLD